MVVIDRILCPVDFSDISRHALRHAAAVARWYDARLTALHVFTPVIISPDITSPELARAAASSVDVDRLRARLQDWLAADAPSLRADVLVDEGPASGCILERASRLNADLIVIGTHGRGGFDRLVLGSVAEKVLRKAACPVMTVPPPASPGALPYKRLLCAVDFSPPSLGAARYALAMAREADARLVLLHVVEWPAEDALVEVDAELQQYRQFREQRAERELAALVPANEPACELVTRLEHGRVWPTVVRVAQVETTDLIVMGIHGRHVLDLTLFGSITNQVVRHATCPVLTIRL